MTFCTSAPIFVGVKRALGRRGGEVEVLSAPLERIVHFAPAFDRRHADPAKNYGVHSVEVRFVLKGEKGAVQFLLFTGWFLPETVAWWKSTGLLDARTQRAMAADLGYHSPVPKYEGHDPMGPCEWLGGKPCYYDGSSLNAEPVFERLLREGGDGVWAALEAYYKDTFGEGKNA